MKMKNVMLRKKNNIIRGKMKLETEKSIIYNKELNQNKRNRRKIKRIDRQIILNSENIQTDNYMNKENIMKKNEKVRNRIRRKQDIFIF